ncbi:hypothetical protein Dacet_0412 [Denitrovibrio acetiphilus DSM 12809]|uniref:Uncharacterized protein n=1 Tax=Denitrovibrio acetiphilus (strain DSM 12809 / NBRC 114555 / N2460) TaxID=522772 RepID=D4H3C7_DENA2|nr:hypothetical protein [Denitrovibrio acetiphilus]ADD67211.1 hypothetical protein Dacet_0412 [Denitrovibrio acetiphilus DSM 12809]
MSYYSSIKKVPGFTVLGPLVMLAGLLFAVDTGMRYALAPEMLFDPASRIFAVANFIIVAIFSFLLLQSGYLLLKGFVFSRYITVMALALCYTGLIMRIFLFGVYPYKWKIIAGILFLAFVILYLNQRQFRVRFEFKRGLAGIFIFFFWFLTLVTAAYLALWAKNSWNNFPSYNTYRFEEKPYTAEFDPLPFNFNIVIPQNFSLSSVDSDGDRTSVTFHNPDFGYIIMNNNSSLEPVYKRMRILGYENAKQFSDFFFHEKIGLIPLFLRKSLTSLDVKEYNDVNVGSLSLYMEKSNGDNTVAHVFNDNNLSGEITVLSITPGETGLYNELFTTIKPYSQDKDAQELYSRGMQLLTDKDPERAKRHFAAASVMKPDDAEFRYMFAETLALTGYVSSAKIQLRICLDLNEGHERARKLLDGLSRLKEDE